jgi:hypothetical protein
MGQSTDGQICYGILFDEGFEFPWGDKDIDDFWLEDVLGFKHSIVLFDSDGEYLNGVEPTREQTSAYFKEKSDFEDAHRKCPFKLVNYCSVDCPEYIIAINSTVLTANRGYPIKFDPNILKVTNEQIESLIDFCHKCGIICDSEPFWYLSSYLG